MLHVGSLSPQDFGARDLAVLQVAAARAAPGVERARLISAPRHEQRVAMVLQRSLLPKHLVETIGISVGVCAARPAAGLLDGERRPPIGWRRGAGGVRHEEIAMPDPSQKTHPDELQSDLDLLVEMTREPKRDAQAIHRHLESLKAKLDNFIHERIHAGDRASH